MGYIGAPSLFPVDDINPSEKDRSWHLQYAKAIEYRDKRSVSRNLYRREQINTQRLYADGNQPVDKYQRMFGTIDEKNIDGYDQKVSYIDVNMAIMPIMTKFVDIAEELLKQTEFDIDATDIDPTAVKVKENQRLRVRASMAIKPLLQFLKDNNALEDIDMNSIPENLDELQIFAKLRHRLRQEIVAETGIRAVLFDTMHDEVVRRMDRDAVVSGEMACWHGVNAFTGKIESKYVDIAYLIADDIHGHHADDQKYIGFYEFVTIQQLKNEMSGELTRDQIEHLVTSYGGLNGYNREAIDQILNQIDRPDPYSNYYTTKVPVLRLYWRSTDITKKRKKKVHGMEMHFGNVDYNEPTGPRRNGEIYETHVETVHRCSYIPGTDIIYDYGKHNDITRYSHDKRRAMFPIQYVKVSNTSLVDRMIPLADQVQLSWIKIQNLIAKTPPNGLVIRASVLRNLNVDGNEMSMQAAIMMFQQSGVMVIEDDNLEDGIGNQIRPFEEHNPSFGPLYQNLLQHITTSINLIKEVTGLNDFMSSSNPGERAAVGVGQIALQAGQNAIAHVMRSKSKMHLEVCYSILSLLQIRAKVAPIQLSYPDLGIGTAETLEIGSEIGDGDSSGKFKLYLRPRPTQQQIAEIKQQALSMRQVEMQGGIGITYADYLYVSKLIDSGNFEYASAILAQRVEKNRKQKQQEKMQMMQMQSQMQQQQIATASQARMAESQNQAQVDLARQQVERERPQPQQGQ